MPNYVHTGPNLYLTADRSRVVREGDTAAAFLLVANGSSLAEAEARQYGLVDDRGQAVDVDKVLKTSKGAGPVVPSIVADEGANLAEVQGQLAAALDENRRLSAELAQLQAAQAQAQGQGQAVDEQPDEQPADEPKASNKAATNKAADKTASNKAK